MNFRNAGSCVLLLNETQLFPLLNFRDMHKLCSLTPNAAAHMHPEQGYSELSTDIIFLSQLCTTFPLKILPPPNTESFNKAYFCSLQKTKHRWEQYQSCAHRFHMWPHKENRLTFPVTGGVPTSSLHLQYQTRCRCSYRKSWRSC